MGGECVRVPHRSPVARRARRRAEAGGELRGGEEGRVRADDRLELGEAEDLPYLEQREGGRGVYFGRGGRPAIFGHGGGMGYSGGRPAIFGKEVPR
eukprot:7377017-Prymnesium_polylepis.1